MVNWHRFIPSDFEYDLNETNSLYIMLPLTRQWNVSSQILKCAVTSPTVTATN